MVTKGEQVYTVEMMESIDRIGDEVIEEAIRAFAERVKDTLPDWQRANYMTAIGARVLGMIEVELGIHPIAFVHISIQTVQGLQSHVEEARETGQPIDLGLAMQDIFPVPNKA